MCVTVSCVVLIAVGVTGVTQLHDVVYIVCCVSSTILRFNATTHERLTDIDVKDLREPWDIVACEQTSRLYVADYRQKCVWQGSADGTGVMLWLVKSSSHTLKPDTFRPYKLSVTSTRLLVTSIDTKQLIQLDSVGDQLRCVQLPDHMKPFHAVESQTTTFIVSHENKQLKQINTNQNQYQISEVNADGQVLRQFTGSHLLPLGSSQHVAVDSHGNVFVADFDNRRVYLLDAQLKLRRVIIDEHQLNYKQPWRLCYSEPTGQLFVGLYTKKSVKSVAVFDVLRR